MCLENTHNLCYGATIDNHYINEVKNILNENQIKLHIDGARIFNASVSLQIPIKTLVKDQHKISDASSAQCSGYWSHNVPQVKFIGKIKNATI